MTTTSPIDVRQSVSEREAKTFDTAELRSHFLLDKLFEAGKLNWTYLHDDRMVVLGAVPTTAPLTFPADLCQHIRETEFLARRELGIINIGGPAKITADGTVYEVDTEEALYLGKGTAKVTFESKDPAKPARLYMNSCPAHAAHPGRKITKADADPQTLGSLETSNKRVIRKYIHAGLLPTCQLVMGLTRLETGSVWNTMPCHVHDRRIEVYLYFNVPENAVVFHMMGRPDETRHIVVRNEQAVASPPWSIQSGCATASYAFIWSMDGENQVYTDMDPVAMTTLA
jgi:4-deoxy-L-threo-5-hexosulose-uronate ketol-isomerase